MLNSEKKYIIFLAVFSFVAHLIPAYLYITPSEIPHDFRGIVFYIESFLRGSLYTDFSMYGVPAVYGGLFSIFMAAWTSLVGKSFYAIMIPYVLFDVLNVVVIYYIVKELSSVKAARYAGIFFSLSYISLMNVVHGSTNPFFMFFMLLSIYFLTEKKERFTLSAFFLAIGMGFKVVPLVIFLPVVYFVYQKRGCIFSAYYALLSLGSFLLMLLPFYLQAGFNAFFPYFPNGIMDKPDGSNFLTLYSLIDYFLRIGYSTPYKEYIFPNQISTPFLLIGYISVVIYILKNSLHDKKLELIRNSFLFIFTGLMFGKIFYSFYIYTFFPLILVMFFCTKNDFFRFRITYKEVIGFCLVYFGIVMAALLYRWEVEYSFIERTFIILGSLSATIGTFLVFRETYLRIPLAILVFSAAFESQLHAYVLKIFGDVLPIFATKLFARGGMQFGVNVSMIVGMLWLFFAVHYALKEKDRNKLHSEIEY